MSTVTSHEVAEAERIPVYCAMRGNTVERRFFSHQHANAYAGAANRRPDQELGEMRVEERTAVISVKGEHRPIDTGAVDKLLGEESEPTGSLSESVPREVCGKPIQAEVPSEPACESGTWYEAVNGAGVVLRRFPDRKSAEYWVAPTIRSSRTASPRRRIVTR